MELKCKMCGGILYNTANNKIVTCEYCGTKQTVPCLDSERIADLYARADEYRRKLEFDKAMALYEEILNENTEDAEAYWRVLLCQYGIEYVEDVTEGKRVPTINRMQYGSVYDNENYKAALKHSDEEQAVVYRTEAEVINGIQKGILEISEKEEPFDIFICYKEGDGQGRRTLDSVLATDIYELLTGEGYKVFFSRITLDDKFGMAYEPYIFAALQSSKIMIAVGTKRENYEAVWVRNEWSRYLSLIKSGAKKVLIPAYKGMNPYELPEEFAHLQAINLDELGYQQDLLAGIRKIISVSRPKIAGEGRQQAEDIAGLFAHFYFNMEHKKWEAALQTAEKILKAEPHNFQAKLGALLAAMHIFTAEDMKAWDITGKKDFLAEMKAGNRNYMENLYERLQKALPKNADKTYYEAVKQFQAASTPEECDACLTQLKKFKNYKNAADYAKQCKEKRERVAESLKKEMYLASCDLAESNDYNNVKEAMTFFKSVPGYLDADNKLKQCSEWLTEYPIKLAMKKKAEKRKKTIILGICISIGVLPVVVTLFMWIWLMIISLS